MKVLKDFFNKTKESFKTHIQFEEHLELPFFAIKDGALVIVTQYSISKTDSFKNVITFLVMDNENEEYTKGVTYTSRSPDSFKRVEGTLTFTQS